MNKEELEKEAEEKCAKYKLAEIETYEVEAYIEGAEPREKQIQIDAEQIRALQKQNGELTDRVKELERKLEQTEKDLADYQFNYPTIKEVQKRNTELEKELVELKNRNGVLAGQKASLGRWLGEAITVIKKFSEFLNDKVEYDPEHSQEHTTLWNELCERTERFLKEFMPPEV